MLVWLGYINFLLLAFNLVPAFPLDGGRVLRAALWARKRNFAEATWLAAEISRGFAFLMIGGGLLFFVAGGAFTGAWLAFLGWFLLQAAASEARYPLIREALAGLTVRDFMVPHPITARPDQTLGEFMDEVAGVARFTTYPVVRDGDVLGMLPFTRILRTPRADWAERRVADCMLSGDEVPVFAPDAPALDALADLGAGHLHRGLVVDGGRFVGLVSITDIARILTVLPQRSRPVSTP